MFRREAFNWARTTARLVESSRALGPNTRVAYAALADIEHARDMLNSLVMPLASKTPAAFADRDNDSLTAKDIQSCVSDLALRVRGAADPPCSHVQIQELVDNIVDTPPVMRISARHDQATPINLDELVGAIPKTKLKIRHSTDLNAYVRSRNGKMLWADIDCPECPSKAGRRCQKAGGIFIEKPHPQRKDLADVMALASKVKIPD